MDDAIQQANNIKITELMRAGRVEFANGNRRRAHVLWQQAATLRPLDAQIWKTLLDVVETTNDRRVCLENIITINPDDILSRLQLDSLREQEEMHKENRRPSVPRSRYIRWLRSLLYLGRVLLALLGMAMLFVLGLLIGIAFHLL